MHGLVDTCFEEPRASHPDDIRRGEIYDDQPVYLPARHALLLTNVNPQGTSADYEISGRTENVFRHSPLKHPIELPDGEALVVGKAKWGRPVLVISQAAGSELIAASGGSRATDCFLCAPVYGGDQFPRELLERVRAYEFPNLFYLPQCSRPHIDEGFVRLDHAQSIRRTDLRARRARLTGDAMAFFDEWFTYYVTERLPEDSLVHLYRSEVLSLQRRPER